jgi:hypothetical protein
MLRVTYGLENEQPVIETMTTTITSRRPMRALPGQSRVREHATLG